MLYETPFESVKIRTNLYRKLHTWY
jgi:hypothetical protein